MKTSVLHLVACTLLSVSFSLGAFSQKHAGLIKGQLLSADGTPAANVNIEFKKLKRITVSDDKGLFVLMNLPALHDTLVISSVGVISASIPVNIDREGPLDIGTIHLQSNVGQLQKVEIDGRTTRSYKSDYSFFGAKTQTPVKDIPQSISTVTKELIQDKMEFSLKDVADEVAGVNQYSGFDEYTIRGFRAENSRDINGLRGYNMIYTSPLLVNIERVEIIKGPTATLYGNCDPGGTINLVTKKPLDVNEAEVNIYGGSWDHVRADADLTGPLDSSKTLLYRFNVGADNSNSFQHGQYGTSMEVAPSITWIVSDKLKINLDFSLSKWYGVLNWGQPGYGEINNPYLTPISLSANQPGDYMRETDIASIATVSYKINKTWSFNSGYLNYITREYVATHGIEGYITPDSADLFYTTWSYPTMTNTISNYFTHTFNTGRASNEIVFGYDYIVSRVNLNQQYYEVPGTFGVGSGIAGTFSLKNPQWARPDLSTYQVSTFQSDATAVNDNIYHTQGLYAQDELSYKKWKVLFSLREEFYKGDTQDSIGKLGEQVFLPRLGIVYDLIPNISLYATYNKGFDAFEASTSTQVFGAVNFKPQTSILYETGVKGGFFQNRLSASFCVYQLTLLNVAVPANDPANPNLYVQQGQNRSSGAEVEASGKIWPNLSLTLSYAYCNAVVTQSKVPSQVGTRVENAPYNESGSWIKYTFAKSAIKGFGFSIGHSSVGWRETLDSNITLPGYLIVHVGFHYDHRHYSVALNVNNITNQTYWMGAYNNINKWPGQPRNFMLRLGYRL